MTRIANFLTSQDFLQRLIVSPRHALAALFGLVIGLVAIFFPKEFFVILAGLTGTAAGYALYNFPKSDNPVATLRPLWKMRRLHAMILGSLTTACLAVLLFLQGIGAFDDQSTGSAVYTALAYAFFAFSVSSYLFGRQSLSQARRKMAKASVEEVHAWQMRADAARKSSLLDVF
ncbi:hypothetical protein [uncultured Roseobacter sp.]|uniref:hypothetical protein n=1 Tax=uncultured Roseobacter sp. TaxID=114847 RepID=UPI00262ABC2A|nr:hypothetical protein [uncultured Roseobacter sp.]